VSPHTNTDDRIAGLEKEVSRLRAAVEELTVLNDIALGAGAKVSVDETLDMVVEKAIAALDAEQGSLLISTGAKDTGMKTLIRQGARSSLREAYHVGIEITGYVLRHLEPLLIEDLSRDERFEPTEEERSSIHSVLCVPVFSRARLVGAMMMTNKIGAKCFTEDDQKMLTVVASLAGQLLVNRTLQDETIRHREELALARVNAEKLQEINEAKSRFFSNVSHDLRTPLSLILAPLEELAGTASSDEERKRLGMIRRNARQLLRMITQLLDVSRVEAGSVQVHASKGNVGRCLRTVVSSFGPLARQKEIRLNCEVPDGIQACYDQEILEKVIYNLVSNALKFTHTGGAVNVTLTRHKQQDGVPARVEIAVEDTGIGIPEEDLCCIFERYHQARNSREGDEGGSGIGLALVKEYAELHGGKVTVSSRLGEGSRFLVTLPADCGDLPEGAVVAPDEPCVSSGGDEFSDTMVEKEDPGATSEIVWREQVETNILPLLLVVEDHAETRTYIRDTLKGSYRVIEAQDGVQGVELAVEAGPDLVISDVLMPGLSGTDLCLKLKQDVRTSHIPIILLTAKADPESKVQGLQCGADDYVAKPFSWQEMKSRVANLLEVRRRLREKFSKRVIFEPGELDIPSADEAFLRRVHETINSHLGDENFDVDELAREVSLSYSQLQRKIRALTGQPPTHYIRKMRLHHGREMLLRNAGTVSEIAYSVGFNSPAYFTRCFHSQYGIPPSEVRRT